MASLGATLLSRVLVEGHDRVGYFSHRRVPLRTESAWPALIDRDTFAQAHAKLAARAHQVIHLRAVRQSIPAERGDAL